MSDSDEASVSSEERAIVVKEKDKKKSKKKSKSKDRKLITAGDDDDSDDNKGAGGEIVPYDGSDSDDDDKAKSTAIVKAKKDKKKKSSSSKSIEAGEAALVPFEEPKGGGGGGGGGDGAGAGDGGPEEPEKLPFAAWSNKPKKVKEDDKKVMMKVPEKTDLWRKTRHDFIMDNAPFYWHRVSGDFEVIVKVTAALGTMYDRAGIQIREDNENWMTSGMEIFNDEVNHANCVTKDYSDWSLAALPGNCHKEGVWFCVKRMGLSYECFYSLDGKKWVQTRQGMISEAESVRVGIYAACPQGESFKATFENYRVKKI